MVQAAEVPKRDMKQSPAIHKAATKQSPRYLRDKDREKVRGIFRFYEVPGGVLEFMFRKHKGDPVELVSLRDGEVCTVSLGVARHLNSSGKYPEHAFKQQEDGKPAMEIGRMVRRYGFQSLEFTDVEGLDEPMIVEMVDMDRRQGCGPQVEKV